MAPYNNSTHEPYPVAYLQKEEGHKSNVHNSKEGHWGLAICKKRRRDPSITDRAIHLDHIGQLTADVHGNKFILVLIDAFSRWVELFPTKTTTALESASCMLHYFRRFGAPEVVHTD